MNDDELITLVRAQRDKVPMTIPVEEIISRGRAVRTRRLVPGAAGALAIAAGVALAVSVLAPASHQASHQPAARLAAWTVTKLADGNISVTINQLKDPAGLQSTLRADGVPASVTFIDQQNPACRPYPGGTPRPGSEPATTLLKQVFPQPYGMLPAVVPSPPFVNSVAVVIDPSALPGNSGVQLAPAHPSLGPIPHRTAFLVPKVVYASAQCTGS
jgi:hypothetical protein